MSGVVWIGGVVGAFQLLDLPRICPCVGPGRSIFQSAYVRACVRVRFSSCKRVTRTPRRDSMPSRVCFWCGGGHRSPMGAVDLGDDPCLPRHGLGVMGRVPHALGVRRSQPRLRHVRRAYDGRALVTVRARCCALRAPPTPAHAPTNPRTITYDT